jgi:hypothetical protein
LSSPKSLPAALETTCSDCGHRQRQSASSNPPAKSLKNHIIGGGVFTQPGPDPDLAIAISNHQSALCEII